ncbi:flavin reductase [Falsiroseomonas tokyonensis]|uniref:Flavin reductase n=1 Tax=Falsiroseomonas tokyonensis TaxID=430521 RepID=A0ABV7BZP8_9PROT|nr:flavin reductase [Falsiroseomonas tokyonensis]MBU8541118.1 flavin reductase [Falsiroseomonas tokyonensis]
MTVSRDEFRDAMARLGAAVNVVTSAGVAGRGGFTASAVCSVTDDPPTLLVCLNRTSSGNALLKANGVLCVNTLAAGQRPISDAFAGIGGLKGESRFVHGDWSRLVTGAPVLEAAAVSFDCEIADVVEKGTHSVFFAEVRAIRQGAPGRALIWYGRGYHPVGHDEVVG